jgi:indoleamine 2,3-dioxygenase
MSQVGSGLKASGSASPARGPFINPRLRSRGFLPEHDPLIGFPSNSEFAGLDEVGRDLPSLLQDPGFRDYARSLEIPLWPADRVAASGLPARRWDYFRVSLPPINQVARNRAGLLANLARPLCRASEAAEPSSDSELRRLRFVQLEALRRTGRLLKHRHCSDSRHLFDEHWFILVHVRSRQLLLP